MASQIQVLSTQLEEAQAARREVSDEGGGDSSRSLPLGPLARREEAQGVQFEVLEYHAGAFVPSTVGGRGLSNGMIGWSSLGVHCLHASCGWQSPRVGSKAR